MSSTVVDIVTISQVVQAAVAPVFLITGVATLLGILSSRLAQVLDRARVLENRLDSADVEARQRKRLSRELDNYLRRGRLINFAFILSSCCALMVCMVVVLLFYSSVATVSMSREISFLFMGAMGLLILGFLLFLAEVLLATTDLRRAVRPLVDVEAGTGNEPGHARGEDSP